MKDKYENTELMKAMGSKTGRYDPESPDQWLYLLHHGDAHERALAWVKSKTIARSRSPFCVDEHGKPLHVESMAADLGWKVHTAQNVLSDLVKQGRVRLEKGKRIWYRADVPVQNESQIDKQPIPVTHRIWPAYVTDSIKSLPGEEQAKFKAETEELERFQDASFAEIVAEYRLMIEQVKHNMLAAYGVKKKSLTKRREPDVRHVQLQLVAAPESVQRYLDQATPLFVQSPKNGSYKPENGSVHGDASLVSSDSDSDKKKEAAAASFSGSPRAAAAHVVPIEKINAVHERCKALDLQLPDRRLCARLLERFPQIGPETWPRFSGQRSPALWLQKSPEEMTAEAARVQSSRKETEVERVRKLFAREDAKKAKGAAS